jgi:hypothetical protein
VEVDIAASMINIFTDFLRDHAVLSETILRANFDCPQVASLIGMPGNYSGYTIHFCLMVLDNNPFAYQYLTFAMRCEPIIMHRALALDKIHNAPHIPHFLNSKIPKKQKTNEFPLV